MLWNDDWIPAPHDGDVTECFDKRPIDSGHGGDPAAGVAFAIVQIRVVRSHHRSAGFPGVRFCHAPQRAPGVPRNELCLHHLTGNLQSLARRCRTKNRLKRGLSPEAARYDAVRVRRHETTTPSPWTAAFPGPQHAAP